MAEYYVVIQIYFNSTDKSNSFFISENQYNHFNKFWYVKYVFDIFIFQSDTVIYVFQKFSFYLINILFFFLLKKFPVFVLNLKYVPVQIFWILKVVLYVKFSNEKNQQRFLAFSESYWLFEKNYFHRRIFKRLIGCYCRLASFHVTNTLRHKGMTHFPSDSSEAIGYHWVTWNMKVESPGFDSSCNSTLIRE